MHIKWWRLICLTRLQYFLVFYWCLNLNKILKYFNINLLSILMSSANNQFVFVRTNCMFVLLGQYILPCYKSFYSSSLHHLAWLFYEAVHVAYVTESIKHVAIVSDLIRLTLANCSTGCSIRDYYYTQYMLAVCVGGANMRWAPHGLSWLGEHVFVFFSSWQECLKDLWQWKICQQMKFSSAWTNCGSGSSLAKLVTVIVQLCHLGWEITSLTLQN